MHPIDIFVVGHFANGCEAAPCSIVKTEKTEHKANRERATSLCALISA